MGRNLVLAAREAGVPQLINLGSSCMYPRDSEHPLREEDLLSGHFEPTNEAYAIAKSAVQRLCAYVSAEDPRLQCKTLIPCNLYGRYDSFDPRRSHLAAAAIHKLHRAKVEGRASVEIWGDGKARREFLYAGDLADAILAAVARFDSLPHDKPQLAARCCGLAGFAHRAALSERRRMPPASSSARRRFWARPSVTIQPTSDSNAAAVTR